MAVDGQETLLVYFMSVGVAGQDLSFEERRIQDYIAAYHSTARPPPPCPQSPDTASARTALGLPPLFVPTAMPASTDSLNAVPSNAPAARPTDLPAHQEFRPSKTATDAESLESISAHALYSLFSHEELRYHAYLAGNKMPPVSPPTDAMAGDPSASPVYPFYANDSRSTAYTSSTAVAGGTPDCLMTIAAAHRFEKHSFEELRIAYLLAGKEVGSSEIPTRGALPAQPAPTLFGRPRGDAFSSGSLKLF